MISSKIQKVVPFIEEGLKSAEKYVGVPLDRIYFPKEAVHSELTRELEDDLVSNNGRKWKILLSEFNKTPLRFYKLEPLNVYIPVISDALLPMIFLRMMNLTSGNPNFASLDRYLRVTAKRGIIDGNVTVVAYDDLVDEMVIDRTAGKVSLMTTEGLKTEDVTNFAVLDHFEDEEEFNPTFPPDYSDLISEEPRALKSEAISDSHFFEWLGKQDLNDVKFDITKAVPQKADKQITNSVKDQVMFSIKGDQSGKKAIPCLTGISGLGKSAIVKSVASSMDLRLIDFRAAFLDRLDMEGMYYTTDKQGEFIGYDNHEEVEKFSRQAYLGDFVKASDQYMAYAQDMLDKLTEIKAKGDTEDFGEEMFAKPDDDTPAPIDQLIEKYKEEAKIPALFFDEIIRAKTPILNLFTILLNERKFGDLTFKKAKIISAANTPEGLSDWEGGLELFVGQSAEDPAILNRLDFIPVEPADVTQSWVEWAKSVPLHDFILEYADFAPQMMYDVQSLNNALEDPEVARQLTYTTFRTWENIDKLLKGYDNDGFLDSKAVAGLMGERTLTHISFTEFLIDEKEVEFDKKENLTEVSDDPLTQMMHRNMKMGVPTGVFTASGFGKTTRVNDIVKKEGWLNLTVQLSQKSTSDLMGAPSVVNTSDFALGDSMELVPKEATASVRALMNDSLESVVGLPKKVTIRAPQRDLRDKIELLYEQKKLNPDAKLVLFFDEANRFPQGQESVQSAVFDAISDHRFAGVDFKPEDVAIVVAANVDFAGPEDALDEVDTMLEEQFGEKPGYSGTNEIDSAFLLRLSSFSKPTIDLEDVGPVRDYIMDESNGYHPIVRKYFKGLDDEEVLFIIRSAEYKSLRGNVPSTRNFESLSASMENNPEFFSGSWFFESSNSFTTISLDITSKSDQEAAEMITQYFTRRDKVMTNWVGKDYSKRLPYKIKDINSAADIINALRAYLDEVKANGYTDSVIKFSQMIFNQIGDAEKVIRDAYSEIFEQYLGTSEVTNGFLNEVQEAMSAVDKVEIPGIIDRETARDWVQQEFIELATVDKLMEEVDEALKYFKSINKPDYAIFVMLGGIKTLEQTSARVFLQGMANLPYMTENDEYFAKKFNKEVADEINRSSLKSLGPDYEAKVKEL